MGIKIRTATTAQESWGYRRNDHGGLIVPGNSQLFIPACHSSLVLVYLKRIESSPRKKHYLAGDFISGERTFLRVYD